MGRYYDIPSGVIKRGTLENPRFIVCYTLWLFNIAMVQMALVEIDDLPIKNVDFPSYNLHL